MAALPLALGALALIVTPASANEVHSLLYQLHFAGPQNRTGQTSPKAFGVALDNSSGPSAGDVYVSHTSNVESQAITLAGSPSGGSFKLGFESCTTAALQVAPAESKPSGAEVKAALEPCVGVGKLFVERTATDSGAVYSVYFGGLPEANVPQLNCNGSSLEPHGTATCTVETTAEGTPNAIAKFSATASSASFLCQITGRGSLALEASAECDTSAAGPGGFEAPRGVAVDPSSGLLYAIDASAHRVYQFEVSGKYTGKSLELGTPSEPHIVERLDVSAATGNVFLADRTSKRVIEWDPASGTSKAFATEAGSPPVPFGSVIGVVVDNDPSSPNYEDVYVADSNSKVVDRFSSTGAYQCQITGLGSASSSSSECSKVAPGDPDGSFAGPQALAVDPSNGHVYVADSSAGVAEFTAAGDFLDALSSNSGDKIGVPYALALSASSGDLFVASVDNPDELYVYGPDAPIVATGHPTSVAASSATLQGTVNPISVEVIGCQFEYLEASKYEVEASEPFASAQNVPCEVEGGGAIGSGTLPVSVHASLTIKANTAYVYRLHAKNARAGSSGKAVLFGPPGAKTEAATGLTQSSATLNGAVEPGNVPTTYQLEYGDPNGSPGAYTHTAPALPASAGEGSGEIPVSQGLSGLQLGATYHYRITATNAIGTYHGADRSFTTLRALLIDAQPAASIGSSSAILQAYVNPLGSTLTNCRFQYVDAAHYEPAAPDPYAAGGSRPCEGSLASGSSPVLAEAKLEGLSPQTEYHFRLTAEDANGKVEGADEPLTTEPAPGSCPNEARREEQGKDALRLPECRAYEQVSPEEKDASPVEEAFFDVAPSGERVVFSDRGVFAGTASAPYPFLPYLAERGPDGWQTTGLNPSPASLGAAQVFQGNSPSFNFSADLGRSVWRANYSNGVDPIYPTAALLTREADGSFVKATPTIEALGIESVEAIGGPGPFAVSEGFSKLLFASQYPVNALDGLGLKLPRLYEVEGFGAASPTLRLVSLDAQGAPMAPCQTEPDPNENIQLGGNASSFDPRARAGVIPPPSSGLYDVSADGSHVYFTAETHADHCRIETYLRLKGTETVEISRPAPNQQCTTPSCLIAPTPPGAFTGASADGSKAFFASGGQLTDEAPQGTASSLYMYDEGRASGHHLIDLSAGDASGSGPGVRFVLASSKDGSRVYFVANGLLTEEPNSLGQRAQPGANNLYVYDTDTERISFIADLSGTDEIVATRGRSAQSSLTPDGRYLLFATGEQLVPSDENEGADLYRYDAQSGALARISVGHNGEDQNGNGGGQAALLTFPGDGGSSESSAVSSHKSQFAADGQTVVFTTARPLQQGDENGKVDLYEWHQGQVSLLTAATKTDRQRYGFLSASGRDIVFTSIEELIPGDKDGLKDVYDARIGGGFRVPITPPICTSAETCHGEPTHEPPPAPRPPFEGAGNEHQCHRGFVKRHGKCVKVRKKKRHRHSRHPHKRGRVNARSSRYNSGGGK